MKKANTMYNKSEIMKTAWEIFKDDFNNGKYGTFSDALKRAWYRQNLIRQRNKQKM